MSQKTQLYEAMYILDSSFSDEEIAAIEERLKAGIESAGAQFESVHEFARRRLAYEIKGHRDGIYRVMYFTGTGTAVDEIKREFELSEDIVRGTVVVANPKMIVGKKVEVAEEAEAAEGGEEIAEGEEAAAEIAEQPVAEEVAPEEAVADEVVETAEPEAAEPETAEPEAAEPEAAEPEAAEPEQPEE